MCMKRCFISYVIREQKVKTTMSYHFIRNRMAYVQNTDNTNRNFHSLLVQMQNGTATLGDNLAAFLQNPLTVECNNHASSYLPK